MSLRLLEATEPADVMDAAGVAATTAVAAIKDEPKVSSQVCLLCFKATRSGFKCSMVTHLLLISVVLLNQQQIETIQQAVHSISRVTRSVAANSPKLAPPSLFSVDKTPNKKMGDLLLFYFFLSLSFLVGPFKLKCERSCHKM